MAEKDKPAERSRLIMELGRLLAPLDKLAEQAAPPTAEDYRVAAAMLRPDVTKWREAVNRFATVGGCHFAHEENEIIHGPHHLVDELAHLAHRVHRVAPNAQEMLRGILASCKEGTLKAIDR